MHRAYIEDGIDSGKISDVAKHEENNKNTLVGGIWTSRI